MMNKVFYLKFCYAACSVTRFVNSRVGSFVIVTSLRTGRCQASSAANGSRPCVHSGSGTHPDCYAVHNGFIFRRYSGQAAKLTAQLQGLQRLRMFAYLTVYLFVRLFICLRLTLSLSRNVYSADVESLANDKVCRRKWSWRKPSD
jgi:hypothetical protein